MASTSAPRPGARNPPDSPFNRACDACRHHKVRCLPDPTAASGKCQRCAKMNRECLFAAPQKRKQRKRTDTRVAELEREVQAMRTLFDQKKSEGSGSPAGSRDRTSMTSLEPQNETDVNAGLRTGAGDFDFSAPLGNGVPWPRNAGSGAASSTPAMSSHAPTPAPLLGHTVDVVDRGIITMDQARDLFQIYKKDITPHFPAVVFHDGDSIDELRKTKPTLFLAVVAAASGKVDPSLYSILHSEVVLAYAHRTLVLSEKNLELVQAMVITVLWYYPPGKFSQLKFYEYIHMAATMAIDIGIGSTPRTQRAPRGTPTEVTTPTPGQPATEEELSDIVKRRTFLACYVMTTSVAMNLRRPSLLRFNHRIGDCIEVLSQSPYASSEDRCMARWARLVNIGEEVSSSFSFDDLGAIVSFSEPKVQLMLKGFQKRLEAWKKEVPLSDTDVSLMLAYYHVSCFVNELAMHDNHSPEDFRPPYRMNIIIPSEHPNTNVAQYVDSLASCVSSAHACFDLFKSTDVEVLRAFPSSNYARLMYSAIILVKLHASARHPFSYIGEAVDIASLKVDFYLDTMIEVMMQAVGAVEFRSAYTFLGALMRLRKWHKDQEVRSSVLGGEEAESKTLFGPNDYLTPPPTTEHSPDANTGIVVLQFEDDVKDEKDQSTLTDDKMQLDQANTLQPPNSGYMDDDIMAIFNDMGSSFGCDITSWEPSMTVPPDLNNLQMSDMYNWGYGNQSHM